MVNNVSKWQMGFNSAFKGLNQRYNKVKQSHYRPEPTLRLPGS
jgi:hypothetical protein